MVSVNCGRYSAGDGCTCQLWAWLFPSSLPWSELLREAQDKLKL